MKGPAAASRAELRKAWLRRVQRAYSDMLWRYGLKLRPATVTLSLGRGRWGWWDGRRRCLGLSQYLLLEQPWEAVMGILGHELAHQMVSELGGPLAQAESPHGPCFQAMAHRLGLDPFYLRAEVDLRSACPQPWPDRDAAPQQRRQAAVLAKVQKLLALSSSPVAAEAQAALSAAARLMAKHNLELLNREGRAEPYEYRSVGLSSRRISPRLALVAQILSRHFFVETIFVPGYNPEADRDELFLELLGRPGNTRLAEYALHFLLERSESLWQSYRRRQPGGGLATRHSFMRGLLTEFDLKLSQAAAHDRGDGQGQGAETLSLMVLNRDQGLADFISRRHPRLKRSQGAVGGQCPAGDRAGRAAGRALNFSRPLEEIKGSSVLLIGQRIFEER